MYVIICKKGKMPIPIMIDEEEMKIFLTKPDAKDFCQKHFLCRASTCIIVNLTDFETEVIEPS